MALHLRAEYLILIPIGLQLLGLSFAVLIDPYILKKRRNIMLWILLLVASLIATDMLAGALGDAAASPAVRLGRTLQSIYGYVARPTVILLLIYLFRPDKSHKPFLALTVLCAAVYLTALFSPLAFTITEDNHFLRGPLGFTSHVVSGVLLLYLLRLTQQGYDRARKAEALIPLLNTVLIVAAVAADTFILQTESGVTVLSITMVSCTVFFYIWLHLLFVREHEAALLAEQRIRIMMSQIQPHFLYNTLSTIQALCLIDPKKAAEVTEKFGAYLRQNLDSLGQTQLVPVSKELEHTRIYAEIEETRFPYIRVEYDARDTEFLLPALTIQPLVENAIRHGVRIRDDGLVTVATRRADGCHEIVIRDNGKGFDPRLAERADETHIGIRNVRERLENLCGGTLEIESAVGEGTTVTIRIPA